MGEHFTAIKVRCPGSLIYRTLSRQIPLTDIRSSSEEHVGGGVEGGLQRILDYSYDETNSNELRCNIARDA